MGGFVLFLFDDQYLKNKKKELKNLLDQIYGSNHVFMCGE